MLKKRTLLLGAALAAFGAIMAGSAFANPQSTVNTNGSQTVHVKDPVGVAQIVDGDNEIPAGVTSDVGDLQVSDNDSEYNVQMLTATLNGGTNATGCNGVWDLAGLAIPSNDLPDFTWTTVADLTLNFPITDDEECYAYGAYVTVVFEAIP